MEYYLYIKSLHLIFVITWFAGLFYIPRLFVYQIEAFYKPSPDKEILGKQLKLMAKRLWYIITWPSGILAIAFGVWLLVLLPSLLFQPWMLFKLGFIVLLIIYQLKSHQYYRQLQNDVVLKSSNFMRIWNEGATFILFAVVFLVILRDTLNWILGILSLVLLGVLISIGFSWYKKIRDRNPEG